MTNENGTDSRQARGVPGRLPSGMLNSALRQQHGPVEWGKLTSAENTAGYICMHMAMANLAICMWQIINYNVRPKANVYTAMRGEAACSYVPLYGIYLYVLGI